MILLLMVYPYSLHKKNLFWCWSYIKGQVIHYFVFIGVHIETKKLPSINKGGIARIFLLYRRRFNIDQSVFGAVLECPTIVVILSL